MQSGETICSRNMGDMARRMVTALPRTASTVDLRSRTRRIAERSHECLIRTLGVIQ